MGVRNPMSSKKLPPSQLRKFRSDVAKLKAKGLVSKSKDARKQEPTRYMLGQVKKYSDVLAGKATVVTVPKSSTAKEYSQLYRTKGKHVVVPSAKSERVRYNARTGQIVGNYYRGRDEDGEPIRITRMYPKTPLVNGTADLPQGPNIVYTIPFYKRGVFRTNSLTELYGMLRDLIASGWENVNQFVIVETVNANGRAKLSGL